MLPWTQLRILQPPVELLYDLAAKTISQYMEIQSWLVVYAPTVPKGTSNELRRPGRHLRRHPGTSAKGGAGRRKMRHSNKDPSRETDFGAFSRSRREFGKKSVSAK